MANATTAITKYFDSLNGARPNVTSHGMGGATGVRSLVFHVGQATRALAIRAELQGGEPVIVVAEFDGSNSLEAVNKAEAWAQERAR